MNHIFFQDLVDSDNYILLKLKFTKIRYFYGYNEIVSATVDARRHNSMHRGAYRTPLICQRWNKDMNFTIYSDMRGRQFSLSQQQYWGHGKYEFTVGVRDKAVNHFL